MSALAASISCLCIAIIFWRCSARIWFLLPRPEAACGGPSCAHIAGVRANIRTRRKFLIFIAILLSETSDTVSIGPHLARASDGIGPQNMSLQKRIMAVFKEVEDSENSFGCVAKRTLRR